MYLASTCSIDRGRTFVRIASWSDSWRFDSRSLKGLRLRLAYRPFSYLELNLRSLCTPKSRVCCLRCSSRSRYGVIKVIAARAATRTLSEISDSRAHTRSLVILICCVLLFVSRAVLIRPPELRDLIANADSDELRARLAELEARAIRVRRVQCSANTSLLSSTFQCRVHSFERQAKQCFTLVVSGAVSEGKSRKPGVAGVDTDATRPSHSLHVLARSVDEADLLLLALRRALLY